MANNLRPETMARITTPALAQAFIDEQIAVYQDCHIAVASHADIPVNIHFDRGNIIENFACRR